MCNSSNRYTKKGKITSKFSANCIKFHFRLVLVSSLIAALFFLVFCCKKEENSLSRCMRIAVRWGEGEEKMCRIFYLPTKIMLVQDKKKNMRKSR